METEASSHLDELLSEESYQLSEEEKKSIRILVVDDDPSTLESCQTVLSSNGFRVECVRKGAEAISELQRKEYHILMVDQNMPEVDGLDVLAARRKHSPDTLAIMMTGYASTGASIVALRAGAWDYLPKPFTATQVLVLVERAAFRVLQMRPLTKREGDSPVLVDGETPILGKSQAIRDVVSRALKVAKTDASVFITGESGTGKELVARCIHDASLRHRKPFVVVNCAALPGELLESEMFGHRKGAFTGAVRDKPGLVEVADQGTFFLDELCEMPLNLQPKLLRVLQDGVVRRVGSEGEDAVVDVRLISATNRDPDSVLGEGYLREDLYYRLRVVPIHIPPLRDRREDIPVLVDHFLRYFWRRHQLPGDSPPELTDAAREMLVGYRWPGNIRQLRNVVEQMVVLSDPEEPIDADEIEALSVAPSGSRTSGAEGQGGTVFRADLGREYHDAKQDLLDRFEREYLVGIVREADGNMSEAARRAGIDRTTLYRLLDKHELSKSELTS